VVSWRAGMDTRGVRSYDDVADIGELYDHVAPYVARPDVPFYVDATRQAGSVLELGCGTGRILIPVARAGASIVGLDLSGAMLARCKAKVAEESKEIRDRIDLRAADARSFDLGRRFDVVTFPFRAFQHLVDVTDQLACLDCVRRHLSPDGRLVLDVFNPDIARLAMPSEVEHEDTPWTPLPNNRRFRRTARVVKIDPIAQVSDIEISYYVIESDGREERRVQAFPMRWFFKHELEHLFARAGFTITEIFGNFDRSPLRQGSPEMVIVARHASA
jgi:SAM-dependent methyltransferase